MRLHAIVLFKAATRSSPRLYRLGVHRDLVQADWPALHFQRTPPPVFQFQDWLGSVQNDPQVHQDIWEMLLGLGMVLVGARSTSLEVHQNAFFDCTASLIEAGSVLTNQRIYDYLTALPNFAATSA